MATPRFRGRHLTLLILLLVIMAASPIVVDLELGLLIINLIGVAVIIAALYAIGDRRHFLMFAIPLSVASLIANWFMEKYPSHVSVVVEHIIMIILLGFFTVVILGYVIRSGKVTTDRIYAGICVYIFIGYAWAFAYSLLDEFQPGSFAAPTQIASNNYIDRVIQMRYFSFVTLATIGYGDITPRTQTARTLTILEAIVGQFYMVALIGRLVSLQIVHVSGPRK